VDELPSLNGYRLDAEIGEGGMATVYQGIQLSLDRPVALKLLSTELASDPTFAKRFVREARIVGRLAHASIVPIYEVGEQDGQYFIAMEYVTGGDLNDARRAGLSQGSIHSIVTQITQALDHAHSHNIVHRDIKPDNVLMRDPETAMVADFGIAREIATQEYATSLTEVRTVIGSPQYMSPEQMRADSLDQRTDIYSLGVVTWQLLTGELPHTGRTLSELAVAQATVGVPDLPEQLSHWQKLISGMLAYDREDRFASCGEALTELARLKTAGGTIVSESLSSDLPTEVIRPRADGSYLSRNAFVAVSIALVFGVVLLLWRSLPAITGDVATTEPTAVVAAPDEQPTDSAEETASPAFDSMLPTAAEYFAFRDLIDDSDVAGAQSFVSTYKGSVLANVLSVYLLQDTLLVETLQEQAADSELKALLIMSELYDNGWGVPADSARAEDYARIANEADSTFARYHLAELRLEATKNRPGPVSPAVLTPLRSSAEQGFFLAQTLLANLEYGGRVVGAPRVDRSIELFERAAAQGDRNALFNLSQVYERGAGIPRDSSRARDYLVRAAELGHPKALELL